MRKTVTYVILRNSGVAAGYRCKNQDTIYRSSTEAGFNTACNATKSILFCDSLFTWPTNKPTRHLGYDIILRLDANEEIVTSDPPPPTYSRGSSRLDYILVSHRIVPHVWRSGILPYNSFFLSDHWPCFIDIDGTQLFQSQTFPLAPSQRRGLQLYDPRITQKYEGNFNKQLEYHKLKDKVVHLHQGMTPTQHHVAQQSYEKRDKLLGESMTYSEHQASRVFWKKSGWHEF